MRRPRRSNGAATASNSSRSQPTPMPKSTRPPDSTSRSTTCFAVYTGLRWGTRQMPGAEAHAIGDRRQVGERRQRLEQPALRRRPGSGRRASRGTATRTRRTARRARRPRSTRSPAPRRPGPSARRSSLLALPLPIGTKTPTSISAPSRDPRGCGSMATFGAETTTDEVLEGIDLTGTVGARHGRVGRARASRRARALAAHGASVILGVRDLDKGEAATEAVRAEAKGEVARSSCGRSTSPTSPRSAPSPTRVAADHDELHLLIANAGVMACPQGTDRRRVRDAVRDEPPRPLRAREPARAAAGRGRAEPGRRPVVGRVTASATSTSTIPGWERTPYDPWRAYGRAKTANVQFAVALDRRLRDRGVRATAVHPGRDHDRARPPHDRRDPRRPAGRPR